MRILAIDTLHESIFSLAISAGLTLDYRPDILLPEFESIIDQYQGLIIRSKFKIDKNIIDKATQLKLIARAGAGLDQIDVAYCETKKIQLFTANEANSVAVAEHLIAMLLGLFNHIPKANTEVKSKIWLREDNRGEQLSGKTVGIIGFGHNGSQSALKFAALGCKVLTYDKYKLGYSNDNVIETSMDQLFEEADIISLHVPLSSETQHLVNAKFIQKVKKPFYFCNVARGELVNQIELCEGLKSGKILGACLDVLENEKLHGLNKEQEINFDYLRNHPNVILSPHVAGWTHQSYLKINEVLIQKIRDFVEKDTKI